MKLPYVHRTLHFSEVDVKKKGCYQGRRKLANFCIRDFLRTQAALVTGSRTSQRSRGQSSD
jgi:hypothetical protein